MFPNNWKIVYTNKGYDVIMGCGKSLIWYILKMLECANKSYILMKNHKSPIKRWTDLYSKIAMKSKDTQSRFRKEMLERKIIIEDNSMLKLNTEFFVITYYTDDYE